MRCVGNSQTVAMNNESLNGRHGNLNGRHADWCHSALVNIKKSTLSSRIKSTFGVHILNRQSAQEVHLKAEVWVHLYFITATSTWNDLGLLTSLFCTSKDNYLGTHLFGNIWHESNHWSLDSAAPSSFLASLSSLAWFTAQHSYCTVHFH